MASGSSSDISSAYVVTEEVAEAQNRVRFKGLSRYGYSTKTPRSHRRAARKRIYLRQNTLRSSEGGGRNPERRPLLYLRQPDQERGRIAFCWRKDGSIPDVVQPDWQPDTTDLPQEDPLFRSALDSTKVIYVDDVKTAGPGVLNEAFENKTFGHRALIHAPIHGDGKLWGILQPCVFGQPRQWTDEEKAQIESILPRLQPVVANFVAL